MTVYAEAVTKPFQSATLTKTFNIMVWIEVDRVRVSQAFYTVTMTGEQGAAPDALSYTVDGKPASVRDVADIIAWAKNGQGSIEKVA